MAAPEQAERVLLDGEALRRTIVRIAHELVERNPDLERTALVGIHTRGVPFAQRLRREIEGFAGQEVALGTLAIDALFDYGRPERVQLAVLVDRGHRELPIRPDYVGKNLPTSHGERVQVQLLEVDEVDRVLLVPTPEK